MIKNKIKTAAIATAFTILCTVPVFANKTEKNQAPMHRNPHMTQFMENVTMGIVNSIDMESKTITIIDADGKQKKIHINPITEIFSVEKQTMRKAPDKKAKDEKNNSWDRNFKPVGLEDLDKGHWIVIKNFKTHTETIEAMLITVHNYKEFRKTPDTTNAK